MKLAYFCIRAFCSSVGTRSSRAIVIPPSLTCQLLLREDRVDSRWKWNLHKLIYPNDDTWERVINEWTYSASYHQSAYSTGTCWLHSLLPVSMKEEGSDGLHINESAQHQRLDPITLSRVHELNMGYSPQKLGGILAYTIHFTILERYLSVGDLKISLSRKARPRRERRTRIPFEQIGSNVSFLSWGDLEICR